MYNNHLRGYETNEEKEILNNFLDNVISLIEKCNEKLNGMSGKSFIPRFNINK